ncbi:MAG: L-2,4-diaminobutyrate decarboxylase [Fimbriimonadales bacterium]|nr:MAG: L-2,4-diaminobutyrate decarboxylase [Fimbriimonadales bacterium]
MKRESPLDFDADVMRQMGYRVVDALVDYWQRLPSLPLGKCPDRTTLEDLLDEPTPQQPQPFETVLDAFLQKVLPNIVKVDHPRYFAFVPAPNDYVGVLGDFLTAGMNVFVGTWMVGAGATQVERVVIRWLCDWLGFPDSAGGLFVSGGSVANLVCLAAARQRYPDALTRGRVYYSDQTHSCVARAWRILGLREEQLCVLPADEQFQIPLSTLAEQLQRDRAAGWRPFCVVANAGTTNTGAVDPLDALADLCESEGLWLHADGAYGAAAILTQEGKQRLRGIERLHSLAIDPHKWLYQPMMAGCALVREFEHLRAAFRILPPYLQDKERGRGIDLCDYGVELSRNFRALKLWMSLKTHGVEAFRQAMEWNLHLARVAEEAIRRLPDWVIVSPATMGIVAFRYAPPHLDSEQADALNRALVEAMLQDGFALVSSTVLHGRVALRMCTLNPRATEADVLETVRRLHQFAVSYPRGEITT